MAKVITLEGDERQLEKVWKENKVRVRRGLVSGTFAAPLKQPKLLFSASTATVAVGGNLTEPTLTNKGNGTPKYSSSKTSVATVNQSTGEVTAKAAGKCTITATVAKTSTYAADSASYELTVTSGG